MARTELQKRTPRACEHCRQTRRRCEPPYPCRQCVAAGISCEVRTKARPQRCQQRRWTALTSRGNDHRIKSDGSSFTINMPARPNNAQPVSELQSHQGHFCADNVGRTTQGDTSELLKSLVQDMLLKRHGYALNCASVEPPSCESRAAGSSFSLVRSHVHPSLPLSSVHLWNLLASFQKFMGWQDTKLVDIEGLHAIARTLIEHLLDFSPSSVSTTVTAHRLPVDSVALIFSALALGAVATGEIDHGRAYFDISTEMVKHFVSQSTLDLCLAYFLQHAFALRVGTLNYAQGIIAQAIQSAHDLGIHRSTHGIQGLQLCLLIYMADQYCSLTHNTEPTIRTSRSQDHIFVPLSNAKPQLQTLMDLVTLNGYIIEHSHQLQSPSKNDVFELESRISSLGSRLIGPVPAQSSCGSFRRAYEPLARVHTLWNSCRMKLGVPGLFEQAYWLPSLCICVHAAEGVLSTHLQLYRPVLTALVERSNARGTSTEESSIPVAGKLAATWRQVKKIMMSTFVIIFAYWHGEMVHKEASRYVAMTRLLLKYPRWRWGEKLDEALQTLADISRLSDFKLYEHTQMLLPGANEQFLCHSSGVEAGSLTANCDFTADQTETHDAIFSILASWDSTFDDVSIDNLFGSCINGSQSQTLFGLWETI